LSLDPALVAHQFDDAQQQTDASRLGMWAFLATEVMFFGGLFTGYTVYRSRFPQAFMAGSETLDVVLGTVNTAVLITSSLTMAFAVHSAAHRQRKRLLGFLGLTMLLGTIFLGIKGVEYAQKFHEGHVPGRHFHFESELANPNNVELFFSFYFAMTGLHAIHMIIGISLIAILGAWVYFRAREPVNANVFEMLGLYWHLVDIVWIFLFPLLYLVGRHG
jgi:cytochrome c oxidase subunit 3